MSLLDTEEEIEQFIENEKTETQKRQAIPKKANDTPVVRYDSQKDPIPHKKAKISEQPKKVQKTDEEKAALLEKVCSIDSLEIYIADHLIRMTFHFQRKRTAATKKTAISANSHFYDMMMDDLKKKELHGVSILVKKRKWAILWNFKVELILRMKFPIIEQLRSDRAQVISIN